MQGVASPWISSDFSAFLRLPRFRRKLPWLKKRCLIDKEMSISLSARRGTLGRFSANNSDPKPWDSHLGRN
jgi:hypothetical protein